MLEKWRKVVFFGAHTDDEMICAGTLHRLVRMGSEVHVVTFSCAATKEDRQGKSYDFQDVLDEWVTSLDLIGVTTQNRILHTLRPSCDFQPYRQRICQNIYDYVEKHKPDVVFTLSPNDENTAHSIVGVESERVMRGRVPTIVRCQFPWNIDTGLANLFVTLSEEDLEVKRRVINAYQSQKFRYDYETMLLNYAVADGLSVKAPAVEKFQIMRSVV